VIDEIAMGVAPTDDQYKSSRMILEQVRYRVCSYGYLMT